MQELRPREDEDQPASCPNAPRTTQYVFTTPERPRVGLARGVRCREWRAGTLELCDCRLGLVSEPAIREKPRHEGGLVHSLAVKRLHHRHPNLNPHPLSQPSHVTLTLTLTPNYSLNLNPNPKP